MSDQVSTYPVWNYMFVGFRASETSMTTGIVYRNEEGDLMVATTGYLDTGDEFGAGAPTWTPGSVMTVEDAISYDYLPEGIVVEEISNGGIPAEVIKEFIGADYKYPIR